MLIFSVVADDLINDDVLVSATDLPASIDKSILWGDLSDEISEDEHLEIVSEVENLRLANGSSETSFSFLSEYPFIQLNAEDIVDFKLR